MNDSSKCRRWMKDELNFNADAYVEFGEVMLTSLGEDAANALDLHSGPDAEIFDWVWDVAYEVGEWHQQRGKGGYGGGQR